MSASKKKTPAREPDVPQFFRLNIEVGNLEEAARFYGTLLGLEGRRQAGARVYFQAGPVTLQVVDVSSSHAPHPGAKALYFTVQDLEAAFERAKGLGCLSRESVHDAPGEASWCALGVSGPSTRRTPGRTRCASWRRERSTRGKPPAGATTASALCPRAFPFGY